MNKIKIGEYILNYRKKQDLTQGQFGDLLGVSAVSVSKWERDISCPDTQTIPKLAEVFGVSIEELMSEIRQQGFSNLAYIWCAILEKDGRLIGQNVFVRTVINADDGRDIDVLTMGPICITPELKRNGYGKMLLDFSLEKAAEMGFGAVLFEGNIDFYGKSGFDYARKFGIRYHDLPEDADDSFFLCRELIPGYLDEVIGVYQTPQAYYVDDADVEEFDKNFPTKEKLKLPDQIFG